MLPDETVTANQSTPWPSIAVMGGGAVGSFFGGMLARAGAPVTMIARAAHADAVSRDGLRIEGREFKGTVSMRATADPASVAGAKIVLFCVKTLDTETAARAVAPYLEADATVVSLQNGVDNARRLRSILSQDVIPAVVYVSAEMGGPGRVVHNGRGDLVIGAWRGEPAVGRVQEVASLFQGAGVPCEVSAAIDVDLWSKLTMNCAFNAISALTRARYGQIVAHEPSRATLEQAIAECVAVAAADNVQLDRAALTQAAFRLASGVPQALSSTAQDIVLGKRTEIDDLNGYIARRGHQFGVPSPVNQALWSLVRLLEVAR